MKHIYSIMFLVALMVTVATSALGQKYLIPGRDPVNPNGFQLQAGQHVVIADTAVCSDGWGSGSGKTTKGCYPPGTYTVVDDEHSYVVAILICANPPREKNLYVTGRSLSMAPPAPATQPAPTTAVVDPVVLAQAMFLLDQARASHCADTQHLLAQAQAGDRRKKNVDVDVECVGNTAQVSVHDFKDSKPSNSGGEGFWHRFWNTPAYPGFVVGGPVIYGGGGYNSYYGGGHNHSYGGGGVPPGGRTGPVQGGGGTSPGGGATNRTF